MAGLSESHAGPAPGAPNKSAAIARTALPLARGLNLAPAGGRFHSPKDLSRLLADAGIVLSEKAIRERCCLPVGEALRIETNPNFPGRHWIPDSERVRLLGMEAAA